MSLKQFVYFFVKWQFNWKQGKYSFHPCYITDHSLQTAAYSYTLSMVDLREICSKIKVCFIRFKLSHN